VKHFRNTGAVLGKGEDPMLVMEYMEHGSLYDLLHNETMVLDGEILLPILRDITQGGRFLHAADPQVIHGDLKAGNILVDSKFRAKVADFGLSQKKRLGATGTPFWMAPELLRNESTNTAASDVYSFGIILYEVYSRKDPYVGEDPREVLRLVADRAVCKRPPVPKDCPPQVQSLMNDCLVDAPDKRPTFEELDKRLKRVDVKAVEATANQNNKGRVAKNSVSLFDIFPKHIAEALRDGRKVEAEHKEMVTIFFSDVVGFTDLSSKLPPQKVADMLDRLYTKLDKLSDKHDVFKVETIGDGMF
jgi:guanylate cyclase